MTFLQTGLAKAAGSTSYQIARSLRFNSADSAYLSRTPASAGNRKIWTYSAWVKRSKLGADQTFLSAGYSTVPWFVLQFNSNDTIDFSFTAGATPGTTTTQVFRDVSAWYHIVFALDTTQATASNRAKLYINGSQVTSFSTTNYPSQNTDYQVNNTVSHLISGGAWNFDGYITEIHFIDGQALTPTSFGETDSATGVWMPKQVTGMTYGTNGYYLKFADNSNTTAATLGKDSSGNSNNWTPNNFSVTVGVGNDSLVDTPTNYGTDTGAGGEVRGNYCTFNALANGGLTLANGNLDATASSAAWRSVIGTLARSTGKFYYEVTVTATTATNYMIVGVGRSSLPASALNAEPGSTADGWGVQFGSPSWKVNGGSYTNLGTAFSYTTNDVLMVAVDVDAGKFWFGKNGTWILSGDPAAGTNALFTNLTGEILPMVGVYSSGNTGSANFGQRPFAYTAPSGFKALCTQNLPTPAIGATSTTLASKQMNVVNWTGNGSTQSITGVGFQPDFVWIKRRDAVGNNRLYNLISGVTKNMLSDLTDAEQTEATGLTAFGSDGFTLGSQVGHNASGGTYAAWNWKGANTTVSNTSGSITSTVSANPTAGISVVGYTGNNTAGATVGHGLGVAPKMIIVKSRGTENWGVYHTSLGATTGVLLNSSAATIAAPWWNSATPTSSVFSLSSGSGITNTNAQTYIAYCFAEVAGFSKISSYTGNNSADGAFVYCGFRPRYLIIKSTGANGWITIDAVRNSYNVSNSVLFPHAAAAEDSSGTFPTIDFLSNGFKLRNTANEGNASGATYIFAAFAEAPFNYARAR